MGGGGEGFSTDSNSRYLLEKLEIKLKKNVFWYKVCLPFLWYLLCVPSYAETSFAHSEEPLDLRCIFKIPSFIVLFEIYQKLNRFTIYLKLQIFLFHFRFFKSKLNIEMNIFELLLKALSVFFTVHLNKK